MTRAVVLTFHFVDGFVLLLVASAHSPDPWRCFFYCAVQTLWPFLIVLIMSLTVLFVGNVLTCAWLAVIGSAFPSIQDLCVLFFLVTFVSISIGHDLCCVLVFEVGTIFCAKSLKPLSCISDRFGDLRCWIHSWCEVIVNICVAEGSCVAIQEGFSSGRPLLRYPCFIFVLVCLFFPIDGRREIS